MPGKSSLSYFNESALKSPIIFADLSTSPLNSVKFCCNMHNSWLFLCPWWTTRGFFFFQLVTFFLSLLTVPWILFFPDVNTVTLVFHRGGFAWYVFSHAFIFNLSEALWLLSLLSRITAGFLKIQTDHLHLLRDGLNLLWTLLPSYFVFSTYHPHRVLVPSLFSCLLLDLLPFLLPFASGRSYLYFQD